VTQATPNLERRVRGQAVNPPSSRSCVSPRFIANGSRRSAYPRKKPAGQNVGGIFWVTRSSRGGRYPISEIGCAHERRIAAPRHTKCAPGRTLARSRRQARRSACPSHGTARRPPVWGAKRFDTRRAGSGVECPKGKVCGIAGMPGRQSTDFDCGTAAWRPEKAYLCQSRRTADAAGGGLVAQGGGSVSGGALVVVLEETAEALA
jgi:hypothetical protein